MYSVLHKSTISPSGSGISSMSKLLRSFQINQVSWYLYADVGTTHIYANMEGRCQAPLNAVPRESPGRLKYEENNIVTDPKSTHKHTYLYPYTYTFTHKQEYIYIYIYTYIYYMFMDTEKHRAVCFISLRQKTRWLNHTCWIKLDEPTETPTY